jgi:hypothetical protein
MAPANLDDVRLQPDAPPQGPALLRDEMAHHRVVAWHRAAMARRLDHARVLCAHRPGGALQRRRQLLDGARPVQRAVERLRAGSEPRSSIYTPTPVSLPHGRAGQSDSCCSRAIIGGMAR